MNHTVLRLTTVLLWLHTMSSISAAQEPRSGVDWPQFRGIRASGVAEGLVTPVSWNAETGENIKWNTAIPGLAHSSPIVWGNLVCVTTAVSGRGDDPLKVGLYGNIEPVADEGAQRWEVHCLDKHTGMARWTAVAHQGIPKIPRHPKSTHANSTLAADGTHLVAMFGSEGLYGYSLADGRLLWKNDLGRLESGFFQVPDALWGFGSSPVIHEGLVIIQADVLRGSFLAAFDVATGREVWRTRRGDVPTWSTPTVHVSNGRAQVIVNGFRHIGGYDSRTGRELWRMRGGGDIPIPTPVVAGDVVFLTNAHGGAAPIFAVRTAARGDITLSDQAESNEFVVWAQRRDGAYMQTPLVYGDHLYVCRDNGVLNVYEARTGRRIYQQRLAGGRTGFSASAVAADGKIYFTSEEGTVYVVKAGPDFELLAENPMGEVTLATPAISEGVLFVRTRSHLVAVDGGR